MLDKDGYPDEETLNTITNWPIEKGWKNLLEYVRDNWYYPDYFESFNYEKSIIYKISTGGWSGNEEVVAALKNNRNYFWMFCWQASRRGGHYEFEVTL